MTIGLYMYIAFKKNHELFSSIFLYLLS